MFEKGQELSKRFSRVGDDRGLRWQNFAARKAQEHTKETRARKTEKTLHKENIYIMVHNRFASRKQIGRAHV